MASYRLTEIDGQPLPTRLAVLGVERVISGGRVWFEARTQFDIALGADGCICWDLEENVAPDSLQRTVMFARHHYGRVDAARVQFPVERNDTPAEYTAELVDEGLVLRSRTKAEREHSPAKMFGGDHEWRFAVGPDEQVTYWQAESEPWFVVTASRDGREIVWLGRLLTRLLGPIHRWQYRRRNRKQRQDSR